MAAALLFVISSVLTGWSHLFSSFIFWRIVGGVAIGLASNISPTYIAEISPAQWRGRLVSLNQLALVIGILVAQIANWLIAAKVQPGMRGIVPIASWNAQYGWRWMFTAVSVPATLLLVSAPFIPESPRWLVARRKDSQALEVLAESAANGMRISNWILFRGLWLHLAKRSICMNCSRRLRASCC